MKNIKIRLRSGRNIMLTYIIRVVISAAILFILLMVGLATFSKGPIEDNFIFMVLMYTMSAIIVGIPLNFLLGFFHTGKVKKWIEIRISQLSSQISRLQEIHDSADESFNRAAEEMVREYEALFDLYSPEKDRQRIQSDADEIMNEFNHKAQEFIDKMNSLDLDTVHRTNLEDLIGEYKGSMEEHIIDRYSDLHKYEANFDQRKRNAIKKIHETYDISCKNHRAYILQMMHQISLEKQSLERKLRQFN